MMTLKMKHWMQVYQMMQEYTLVEKVQYCVLYMLLMHMGIFKVDFCNLSLE